jgi:lactoylglutathione lyase
VSNGNTEPCRGFGHIAVMTRDVYAACAELEANGVAFQKRPDEGRMKGLAFALDPDGYWVEVVKRHQESEVQNKFTFAQTMFRIKDPVKSLHFYRGLNVSNSSPFFHTSKFILLGNCVHVRFADLLGMSLIREAHLGVGTDWGFSLYFLAHISDEDKDKIQDEDYISRSFAPVLELTHNHGTEGDPNFR